MTLDKLTGGLGSDTFVFANTITSLNTDATRDVITDFNHSQKDKIDLSSITTLLGFSSDNVPAAHKVWFDADTSILYGSTTSNTVSDFSIQLTGVAVLETSDVAFYVPAV
jgi:Ca2+-binding RTX toxin-like protein